MRQEILPGGKFHETKMVLRLFASSLLFIRRKVGLYGLAALALLYAGIFVVTLNLTNLVRGLGEELIRLVGRESLAKNLADLAGILLFWRVCGG
jgi:hypothetical protein